MQKYNHKLIEKKWQKLWLDKKLYTPDIKKGGKNKFYNLWMFPYPSAEGLHAGHAFSSTGSDVFGRFMRMKGYQVFQPMVGFDSFGIHAENYALQIGEHPMEMLKRVTKHYKEQLKTLGHGYDWTRSVTTSDPNYYKWTEWLFLQLFKAGLAYRKKSEVNWCPSCKTVLADEQVVTPAQAGKIPKDSKGNVLEVKEGLLVCERCGTLVEKKFLEQWMFRITDYADKLLQGLAKINWPEKVKIGQTNWIGKKKWVDITYDIEGLKEKIVVSTTRPDTNFGATFVVVAPEYAKENLFKIIPQSHKEKVSKYINNSLNKSYEDRIREGRKKTGVFTGLYAVNPLNNYKMPIWVADFVLMDVGTGAVVGVPGHDKRDFEFAKTFGIPIKRVVVGKNKDKSEITKIEQVEEGEGRMVNSGFLNGLKVEEAISKITKFLEKKGWGRKVYRYHLRDWIISRQRYWGAPIPMIFCQNCADNKKSWFTENLTSRKIIRKDQSDWNHFGWWPVDERDLPVELPYILDYKPKGKGRGPLDDYPQFYKVKCPFCGKMAKRETDVSDTFLDSSWYFLRYPSVGEPSSSKKAFDPEITKRWLPVDLYFGGAEHTVLHLMYSRFVTMVLNDLDYLPFSEPFPWFFAHGLVIKDGAKMSKSRGNVVNPDEYIEKFGADTLRLYLMFMGPMDGYPDFRDTGIEGMRRFVERIWNLFNFYKDVVIEDKKEAQNLLSKMHKTIKKVTEDIKAFKYNTAIAAIMEYVNLLRDYLSNSRGGRGKDSIRTNFACAEWQEALKNLCLILAPFAPHMTEEIWQRYFTDRLKSKTSDFSSVHLQSWPKYDPNLIIEAKVTIAVQVNGKLRGIIEVESEKSKDKIEVVRLAKENGKVKKWIEGKNIKKEIFVPGKLVNLVIE